MYFETNVTVTPGMAKEMLSRNVDNNRPLKTGAIASYARDMAAGNWRTGTGETIKFDTRRKLIDGQNRLHAVVKANVPVRFDIAHDVSVEVMPVLDTGVKRTAGDALIIDGVPQRNRLASVVRWAILCDAGFPMGRTGTVNPTNSEIVQRYHSQSDLFDGAAARGTDAQRARITTGAVAGTAYYLFATAVMKASEEDGWFSADWHKDFFDAFISGAGLEPGSPILMVRNRLIKAKIDRLSRAEELCLLVKAWNAWRRGEHPSRFDMPKGGLTNENFPKVSK